jgi:hypothetical protein
MTLAEQHAEHPNSRIIWRDQAEQAFRASTHPLEHPAVFHRTFPDGSFVQVNVTADGEVTIAPGMQQDAMSDEQLRAAGWTHDLGRDLRPDVDFDPSTGEALPRG